MINFEDDSDDVTLMRQTRYRQRSDSGPAGLRMMQSLTQRLWSSTSRWHVGELAWLRFQHIGRETDWRMSLWQHDEQVVAWAWAKLPGHLDLHLDPAYIELADEILAWFDDVAHGEIRAVTLLDAETELIDVLRRHGYREQTTGPFFIHLRRSLENLPEPAVPDGYTLRPVGGDSDADARARVHRAAFSLPNLPVSTVTADSYLQVMHAWPYRADLDWLVETSDGEPVSFCLMWLDQDNRVGALEPVGTAPEHRRLGLATAAILAALHTAHNLGARSARVCARGDDDYPFARATYQAMGFRRFARNQTFTRESSTRA
jgi:GNAT superfamily N-acetyltransferase